MVIGRGTLPSGLLLVHATLWSAGCRLAAPEGPAAGDLGAGHRSADAPSALRSSVGESATSEGNFSAPTSERQGRRMAQIPSRSAPAPDLAGDRRPRNFLQDAHGSASSDYARQNLPLGRQALGDPRICRSFAQAVVPGDLNNMMVARDHVVLGTVGGSAQGQVPLKQNTRH